MTPLRIAVVGTGFFSHFHFDAWSRMENVELVACCDLDQNKANDVAMQHGIARAHNDLDEMLHAGGIDAVDIVTRPDTHLHMVETVAKYGLPMICQKPLAPTFAQSQQIAAVAETAGVRLMIHENFRFQPWYREIKKLLDKGTIGSKLHTISYRNRAGDGWGEDAYMARQPYFQTMEKFLIHEAGIHTIDTFRYLAGEVKRVWCMTRKLNPIIAGEDSAIAIMEFDRGAIGQYDANRFNESTAEDQRYTFGDVVVEAEGGTIRLYDDGRITIQQLGKAERDHKYVPSKLGFAGDCVRETQTHFVKCLTSGEPFETDASEYLKSLAVQEAMYASAESGQWETPGL